MKYPFSYEEVIMSIEQVLHTFEDQDGILADRRVNSAGVILHIESEVDTLLNGFGLQHWVEKLEVLTTVHIVGSALCISFIIEGKLGVYNVPIYA